MRRQQLTVLVILTIAAGLAGCGVPGGPLPPSLELPRPVTDLHGFRKGNDVHLTWSIPTETTERRAVRRGGVAEVCRSGSELTACGTPVAKISYQPLAPNAPPGARTENYSDHLASDPQIAPTSYFFYAVNVLNRYDRSAGLSNQIQILAAPTLPAPPEFKAELTAGGVRLSWNAVSAPSIPSLRFFYRVYRRESGSNKDVIAGESAAQGETSPTLLDQGFAWEKTYEYRATVVTVVTLSNGNEQQLEGDDTPSLRVFAHDVFPPATPSGLQAVFSGPGQKPFIDLAWTPDTETDLAGYNLFRREGGGQWMKLNSDLIKTPDFQDAGVQPGHKYFYSVSAVDVRGNESPRSEEASEMVPQE